MEAEWADQHMQILEAYKYISDYDKNSEDDERISEQRANSIAELF